MLGTELEYIPVSKLNVNTVPEISSAHELIAGSMQVRSVNIINVLKI